MCYHDPLNDHKQVIQTTVERKSQFAFFREIEANPTIFSGTSANSNKSEGGPELITR
ncbi:hypothetical protein AB6F55_08610 [Providencia hangzhouensis]